MLAWHDKSGQDIITSLTTINDADDAPRGAREALRRLGEQLTTLRARLDGAPADILEDIMTAMQYREYIDDGSRRLRTIREYWHAG